MNIQLNDIGKKYGKNWIFRHVNQTIEHGEKVAIVGNNGSGKSTLLKVIAGFVSPDQGNLLYSDSTEENIPKYIAYCAPYLELVEEMKLKEVVEFHSAFKPLITGVDASTFSDLLGFDEDKFIKDYSSGMKQRLKLLLAFLSDVHILLLDEPTSNLDEQGIDWYNKLVEKYGKERTIMVASNEKREYLFCSKEIDIRSYK